MGVAISAYFIVRSLLLPLRVLSRAMGRVAAGDLSLRVPVTSNDEVGEVTGRFNSMVEGLRERERIRETFGAYVDPEVAEHILEGAAAEGEEVDVTLLFCDVRDFTGFAERAEPRQVVSTLNRLFETAVPVIAEHGGHVDKFIGDGLLAVFGAPRPAADHADQALAAAKKIARLVREGFRDEVAIGIGLNSGTVVAGSIGGAGRLEFSVIGDAVNVAARVEAATRETGDAILLSEGTRERLGDPSGLVERPGIELKGKSEPVTLYAPAG
jgi:adenylate cyclase